MISYSKLLWPTRRASMVGALRDTIKNYPDLERQSNSKITMIVSGSRKVNVKRKLNTQG